MVQGRYMGGKWDKRKSAGLDRFHFLIKGDRPKWRAHPNTNTHRFLVLMHLWEAMMSRAAAAIL